MNIIQVVYLETNDLRLLEININSLTTFEYILPNLCTLGELKKNDLLLSQFSDKNHEENSLSARYLAFNLSSKTTKILKEIVYKDIPCVPKNIDFLKEEGLIFKVGLPALVFNEYDEDIEKAKFDILNLKNGEGTIFLMMSQLLGANISRYLNAEPGANNKELEASIIKVLDGMEFKEVVESMKKMIEEIAGSHFRKFSFLIQILESLKLQKNPFIINCGHLLLESILECILNSTKIESKEKKIFKILDFEEKNYFYNKDLLLKLEALGVNFEQIDVAAIINKRYSSILEYSIANKNPKI